VEEEESDYLIRYLEKFFAIPSAHLIQMTLWVDELAWAPNGSLFDKLKPFCNLKILKFKLNMRGAVISTIVSIGDFIGQQKQLHSLDISYYPECVKEDKEDALHALARGIQKCCELKVLHLELLSKSEGQAEIITNLLETLPKLEDVKLNVDCFFESKTGYFRRFALALLKPEYLRDFSLSSFRGLSKEDLDWFAEKIDHFKRCNSFILPLRVQSDEDFELDKALRNLQYYKDIRI